MQEHEHDNSYTAGLNRDSVSRLHWLELGEKPDETTRAALKRAGWRWSGYRKAWYNPRTLATVPPNITTTDAGSVEYAAERADRLTAAAEKHEQKANAAYQRSNAAVAMIPLGQPILVGHHSERMHRAALRRSHRAMDESVRESSTAERLRAAAESSRRKQARRGIPTGDSETPEAMTRRADRLEADARAMRRNIARYQAERVERGEPPDESEEQRHYEQHCADTESLAAELRARIVAAGGIAADRLNAAAGDLVRIAGFVGTIVRVNPKTYTVRMQIDGWTLKLDRTKLTAIIQHAKPEPGPMPCVWCDRLTTDPQRVCQQCRDRDNAHT
jgi:uncharacterized protein DUF3560